MSGSRTPVELVALDVDGTLLTSDHRITPATRAAVERARSRGVQVLLATSRGPAALASVVAELRLSEPSRPIVFVASQGAATGTAERGRLRVREQRPAPLAAAHRLVEDAVAVGYSVHWFAGLDWYVSHFDATVAWEAEAVKAWPAVRDLLAETVGPDKMMLVAPDEDVATLLALRQRLPSGLVAQVSNPRFLEITSAGVDKSWAVSRYCRRQGISPEAVLAIGDGPNDLGLLAFAGRSIAPANAHPDVLGAVMEVTASNDEDGVALALDRHIP